jgi:hypothetical protein
MLMIIGRAHGGVYSHHVQSRIRHSFLLHLMSTAQPICTCLSHGCVLHETRDEWGVSRKGKRLAVQEYREHRMCDKRLKYMEHQSDGGPSLEPDAAPSLPMLQLPRNYASGMPSSEDGYIGANASGNPIVTSIPRDDEVARSLQNCLSTFQSGSAKGIITEDLVFCDPSETDDPNSPPPLQSHAITNTNFLEYQGWIVTLFLETDKMDCGRFEKCEIMKNQLLCSLRKEWDKLEDIKLRAWQRCNSAWKAHAIPPPPLPEMAQIVDTCSSFLWGSSKTYILTSCA